MTPITNNAVGQQPNYEFDVALSFAGEDRKYVKSIADELRFRRVKVFYDKYEQVGVWGKDLYSHLDDVYRKKARYCVMFVSRHYADKLWTNHERKSAQARAFSESKEYILPARFNDTEIPGMPPTVGYIDLNTITPHKFAQMVVQKIGQPALIEYMPKEPKSFYKFCNIPRKSQNFVYDVLMLVMNELKKTKTDERRLLYVLFTEGCPAELPENIHINVDVLKRVSGFSLSKVTHLFQAMRSLGIEGEIVKRKDDGWSKHFKGQTIDLAVVSFYSRASGENITAILSMILDVFTDRLCPQCAEEAFCRLDFSCLE